VNCIAVRPDGKIWVGGDFSLFNGVARSHIALLEPDGSLDPSFDPGIGPNGPVRCLLARPNGQVLIGGDFTQVGILPTGHYALLDAGGGLSGDFNGTVGVDGPIYCMAADAADRILIGGSFTHAQGLVRRSVVRLLTDGTLDASFNAGNGADGNVFAIYPTPGSGGSTIIVGGDFGQFGNYTGVRGLVTLEFGGAVDAAHSFGSGLGTTGNQMIKAFAPATNDKLYAVGNFNQVAGASVPGGIAMLDPSQGLPVYNFNSGGTGANGRVDAVAKLSDGSLVITGSFTSYNGQSHNRLAKLWSGGEPNESYFNAPFNGQAVALVALEDDRFLAGGNFTVTGGTAGPRIGRICTGSVHQYYPDLDGDGWGTYEGRINTCGAIPPGYVVSQGDACPTTAGHEIGEWCEDGNPLFLNPILTDDCQCMSFGPVTSFPYIETFESIEMGFDQSQDHSWYWGGMFDYGAHWELGMASSSPSQCAFVSVTGGLHQYSNWKHENTMLRRVVDFPASASALHLSFDWIGAGEPGHDKLEVFTGPYGAYDPNPSGNVWEDLDDYGFTKVLDNLTGQSTWTTSTVDLPTDLIGQRGWLVFEWRNDDNENIAQPPGAVDNIHICAETNWYDDSDGDGYGDPNLILGTTCGETETVAGAVANTLDDCPAAFGKSNQFCDDGDAATMNDMRGLDCVCAGASLPWNEDFTNGMGGFTAVNDAANKWYWKASSGGQWYVSGNDGATNDLAPGVVSVSHLVHDVPTLPANTTTAQLRVRGTRPQGGSNYRMKVWLVPSTYSPTAGTVITATGVAPNGRLMLLDIAAVPLLSGTYDQTLTLPQGYAGTSPRLIFEWSNDNAVGGQLTAYEGATIHEIHLCAKGPGFGDADADGILDCIDPCPNTSHVDGEACDDGDPVTVGDIYENCVCAGHTAFTEHRLVVLDVSGYPFTDDQAKVITLREFGTDNGATGYSLVIPHTGTNALMATNLVSEGLLGLSADSAQLVFTGYATSGGTDLWQTSSGTVPRSIGVVDAGGNYVRMDNAAAFFDEAQPHAAAKAGADLWACGSETGLNYYGTGSPTNVADGKGNLNAAVMFNGQLYLSSSSNTGTPGHRGIFAAGAGAPITSGQELTTVVNTGSFSPAGFCFNPEGDVLFIALRATGIQKWVLDGGTWTLAYTMVFADGANGLVADFTNAPAMLYFTTYGGDKLMKVEDVGSGTGTIPVTPIQLRGTSDSNRFRGLAWAPKHPCVSHTWYADAEGDGLGDPNVTISTSCGGAPAGYVADNTDSCPLVAGKLGSTCNDGNIHTQNDVIQADCTCAGIYCPIPVFEATSGTQTICQGSSFSLPPSPAWVNGSIVVNGYNWTGPGPIIPPSASLYGSASVYYPLPAPTPGQYIHYCTVSNGCGSATYTLVSTVVAPMSSITASGSANLCPGSSVTLTAAPGLSYSWYVNNNAMLYYQQSLAVNSSGNYKVLTVDQNHCQSFSAPVTVAVSSPPAVTCGGYGPLCSNGGYINLGGSPAGGTWSGVGVIGPNAQGIYRFTPGVGTRTLTYTYPYGNGCSASCSTTINVQQATTWYADADGDGFGDPATSSQFCGLPGPGWTTDQTDDCPSVFGTVGSTCDDGSSSTIADVLSTTCVCQGVYPTLAARALLQGPYDSGTGLMSDALRSLPSFPLAQPYTALGYPGGLNESGTLNPALLTVSGNNAIVDWVVIELRSPSSPSTILEQKAVLLQRDGDIVGTDGVSLVTFPGASGSYYVAVRHRNHLGCMTNSPVSFGAAPLSIDFSDPALITWGTGARLQIGSWMVLYMGDGNVNGQVKYTGSANDRDPILTTVGSTTPNASVNTYSSRDINMNGQVKYTGSANDRDPILLNVGSTTPNNTRNAQLP